MQVKWKLLCLLGVAFWTAMCVLEFIFGNIIHQGEFDKLTEVEVEVEYDVEEIVKEAPKPVFVESPKLEPPPYDWKKILFWVLFSCSSSVCAIIIRKLVKINIDSKCDQVGEERVAVETETTEEIKYDIPEVVPIVNIHPAREVRSFTTCTTLLDVVKDFPVAGEMKKLVDTDKKDGVRSSSSDHSTIIREYANLSKKMENVVKEKKDMGCKLQSSERDNKHMKQQLDELISDRALLLKKLECATREIKLNTSSKQATLEKLEEAMRCSVQMKDRVVELNKENNYLQEKVKILEERYQALHEHTMILQKQEQTVRKLKELTASINSDLATDVDTSETDITESEREIEKVQNKLYDLERSLDQMRMTVKQSEEQTDNDDTDSKDIIDDDTSISEFGSDSQLHSVASTKDEETKAQIFEEETADIIYEPNDADYEEEETKVESSSTENSQSTITEYESSELDLQSKTGLVSQSPAFQQFLLKVLDGSTDGIYGNGLS